VRREGGVRRACGAPPWKPSWSQASASTLSTDARLRSHASMRGAASCRSSRSGSPAGLSRSSTRTRLQRRSTGMEMAKCACSPALSQNEDRLEPVGMEGSSSGSSSAAAAAQQQQQQQRSVGAQVF